MTDLRKLLIEARAWIVANEKHESVCPTRVMGTWGRCRCGFVSIIGRIDAALSEPVEPIGYIDAEQLRRWNVLKGTEYESPERCYMPFSRKPWKSEMSDCSLAVYAAPASQWRRVEDGLPEVLFDGYSVFTALSDQAKTRTSAENVSDTLDAVVRVMRTALPESDK